MRKSIYIMIVFITQWTRVIGQDLNKMEISPYTEIEGTSISANCKPVEANVVFFTKIKGLKFEGEFNRCDSFPDKNKYVVCIEPSSDFNIRIVHPDYIPGSKVIRKLGPGEVAYFTIQTASETKPMELSNGEYYLNSEPADATIRIEGNPSFSERTPFTFGKGWEAKSYKVTIEKKNYKTVTAEITIDKDKSDARTFKLTPKKGIVSVYAGNNFAIGAKVIFNDDIFGEIPQKRISLRQGRYLMIVEKPGFSTFKKHIVIKENEETNIEVKLYPTKEVYITTDPDNVKGVSVSIDGKYVGKAPLSYDLSIATHIVQVAKSNYQTVSDTVIISENSPSTQQLIFLLNKQRYNVSISTKPTKADVSFDGEAVGSSNLDVAAIKGLHRIKLKHKGYFTSSFFKNVSPTETNEVNKTLFPKNLVNINGLYVLNGFGIELGGMVSNFSIALDWFPAIENNLYTANISSSNRNQTFVFNPNFMRQTSQKVSVKDSTGTAYALKVGFVLVKPFPIRIHVGLGVRKSFYYREVYQARTDFTYSNNGLVNNGEYIVGSSVKSDDINSYIFGVEVPVFHYVNLLTDYWYDAQTGSNLVFGLGLNIFRKYK